MKLSSFFVAGYDGARRAASRCFCRPEGRLFSMSEKPMRLELMSDPEAGFWTLVPVTVGGAVSVGAAPAPVISEFTLASDAFVDAWRLVASASCAVCASVRGP